MASLGPLVSTKQPAGISVVWSRLTLQPIFSKSNGLGWEPAGPVPTQQCNYTRKSSCWIWILEKTAVQLLDVAHWMRHVGCIHVNTERTVRLCVVHRRVSFATYWVFILKCRIQDNPRKYHLNICHTPVIRKICNLGGGREKLSSVLYCKCRVLLWQVEQNQWGADDPQHAYKLQWKCPWKVQKPRISSRSAPAICILKGFYKTSHPFTVAFNLFSVLTEFLWVQKLFLL